MEYPVTNDVERRPGEDYTGHNLVFLVGCPRSGTTWLQRLLSCHPSIRTGQESFLFAQYIVPQLNRWRAHKGRLGIYRGKGLPCYFTDEEFLRIQKSQLVALLQPMIGPLQEGELFLEKTPQHAECIPDIVSFLPEARFIHILRDPRDVVASLLAASRSWGAEWAPGNARAAAYYWTRYVGPAWEASRTLPPGQMLQVRYEDLHADTEGELRRCADFLGHPWSAEDISNAVLENAPSTARKKGGGTPIPLKGEAAKIQENRATEPKGFVRKAQIGGWKTDLTLKEKIRTWMVVRDLMAEVGYDWPEFARLGNAFDRMPKRLKKRILATAGL